MAEKLVSIVIVTRNRRQLVGECLASVYKSTYANYEVILVDNSSSDGTVETVKRKFPKVRVASAKRNLGLNGGKNLGQKNAKGKYIFFLDSDTVIDKNCLREMISLAESDSKIGLVCPKMYYSGGSTIWYAGVNVNLLTSQTKNIGCNEKDLGQYDRVKETLFAPTAYLCKTTAAKKLKGHDETFFMTYGDTDFGFRAREAGNKVMFCPTAKLWHHLDKDENNKTIRALGYNLPMRAYYFARNRVIFMKKHAPALDFYLFLFLFYPLATFYIAYKIISFGGGWQFLKPHLSGSLDGLIYAVTGRFKNEWR